jgi:peptide-methionine (S)-S-oxide reductase
MAGVLSVRSGYSGGRRPEPTYAEVSTGATGHAEVVQVRFDPAEVSYREVLQVFFSIHDPTTPDRQGADVGTQYRSVIFYHSNPQRETAETLIREIDRSGVLGSGVVTEVAPIGEFYPAEDYHQNYYSDNPNQPYCQIVIQPKVATFRARFFDKLKERTG